MRFKIFISSVQSEFAKERKALASFVRSDLLLKTFFEVFLFEEVEACDRTAQAVYLDEVRKCDLYLGLFGRTYRNADATGVSPTEREFDLATELGKQRLAFILKSDKDRDEREMRLISKVESEVVRNAFTNLKDLKKLVYAALFGFEITNPARLPRGWSIARFSEEHTSEPPNKVLAKPMQWAGYVEKAGTGTTDIIEKCVARGLRKPEYAFDGNAVKLTIWRTGAVTSPMGEVGRSKGEVGRSSQDGNLSDRILSCLADGPLRSRELANAMGWRKVPGYLGRTLNELVVEGIVSMSNPRARRDPTQRYSLTEKGRRGVGGK